MQMRRGAEAGTRAEAALLSRLAAAPQAGWLQGFDDLLEFGLAELLGALEVARHQDALQHLDALAAPSSARALSPPRLVWRSNSAVMANQASAIAGSLRPSSPRS